MHLCNGSRSTKATAHGKCWRPACIQSLVLPPPPAHAPARRAVEVARALCPPLSKEARGAIASSSAWQVTYSLLSGYRPVQWAGPALPVLVWSCIPRRLEKEDEDGGRQNMVIAVVGAYYPACGYRWARLEDVFPAAPCALAAGVPCTLQPDDALVRHGGGDGWIRQVYVATVSGRRRATEVETCSGPTRALTCQKHEGSEGPPHCGLQALSACGCGPFGCAVQPKCVGPAARRGRAGGSRGRPGTNK